MKTMGFVCDLIEGISDNIEKKLEINTVADRADYSKWHFQRMSKR